MTNEEIVAAIRDVKSTTTCIDAVVDQAAEVLGGQSAHDSDSERRLLGITAMQKMLGKRRFDEVSAAWWRSRRASPPSCPSPTRGRP